MNGKQLLEGMSYVNDRFVEEAEQEVIPSDKRMIRILTAAAACLVLMTVGAVRFRGFGGPMEIAPDAELENQIDDPKLSATETQEFYTESMSQFSAGSLILQLEGCTEHGFVGTVSELLDAVGIEPGTRLNVVFPTEGIVASSSQTMTEDHAVHKDAAQPVSRIQIHITDYDPETGTVYADRIETVSTGKDEAE